MTSKTAKAVSSESKAKARILKIVVAILCSIAHISLLAQSRTEIGLLAGAAMIPDYSTTIPSVPISVSKSSSLQVTYARSAMSGNRAVLLFEVPVVASPSHHLASSARSTPVSLATLYAAPGLRLAISPDRSLTPWVSFGAGYAFFETSEKLATGATNPDRFRSTGTLQFGGGIDIKTPIRFFFPIGFRAEIRDFYTLDTPNFITTVRDAREHNVIVSGGLVLPW